MEKRKLNLPVFSLVLSIIPWLTIIAELLPQTTATIIVCLGYVSCFASIILAIITIRKKPEKNILLAYVSLVLNILFISAVVYCVMSIQLTTEIVPP